MGISFNKVIYNSVVINKMYTFKKFYNDSKLGKKIQINVNTFYKIELHTYKQINTKN